MCYIQFRGTTREAPSLADPRFGDRHDGRREAKPEVEEEKQQKQQKETASQRLGGGGGCGREGIRDVMATRVIMEKVMIMMVEVVVVVATFGWWRW